jgi:hypothetical protein
MQVLAVNPTPANGRPRGGDVPAPVSDELFSYAVRVVMASVENHLKLAPGETSYLDFVQPYVP